MLEPALPGWTVETVGDDIAWMRYGDDGRLYAISPEAGFFGVAPGTGMHTNANAIRRSGATRSSPTWPSPTTATWWEGMTEEAPPNHRLEGQRLDAGVRHPVESPERPVHGSGRAGAPRSPPTGRDPAGVPISAILFGGRRDQRAVGQRARDWDHGVFLATIASEQTAAAEGTVGALRRPFAMLPFPMATGDYWVTG